MRFMYSLQILLSRTKARPVRTVKQEQEEISPNHVQRLNLISVQGVSQTQTVWGYNIMFCPWFAYCPNVPLPGMWYYSNMVCIKSIQMPYRATNNFRLLYQLISIAYAPKQNSIILSAGHCTITADDESKLILYTGRVQILQNTVEIGYCDYLGTWQKQSQYPIRTWTSSHKAIRLQ